MPTEKTTFKNIEALLDLKQTVLRFGSDARNLVMLDKDNHLAHLLDVSKLTTLSMLGPVEIAARIDNCIREQLEPVNELFSNWVAEHKITLAPVVQNITTCYQTLNDQLTQLNNAAWLGDDTQVVNRVGSPFALEFADGYTGEKSADVVFQSKVLVDHFSNHSLNDLMSTLLENTQLSGTLQPVKIEAKIPLSVKPDTSVFDEVPLWQTDLVNSEGRQAFVNTLNGLKTELEDMERTGVNLAILVNRIEARWSVADNNLPTVVDEYKKLRKVMIAVTDLLGELSGRVEASSGIIMFTDSLL